MTLSLSKKSSGACVTIGLPMLTIGRFEVDGPWRRVIKTMQIIKPGLCNTPGIQEKNFLNGILFINAFIA